MITVRKDGRSRRFRRALGGLMAGALATGATLGLPTAGAATPSEASRQGGAACSTETIAVRNFHVEMKPMRKLYEIGDVVTLQFKVTRPAHEDPAGAGYQYEPPVSFPAEDVNLGVAIIVKDVLFTGFARTDAEGKATVKIKIQPWSSTGIASARAYATKEIHRNVCFTIIEDGYEQDDKAFRVR